LGADDDLEYLVGRLRRAWPDVVLVIRGDAGFGVPAMYAVCERLGLLYTFGLASNAVLQRHSEALLAQAVAGWEQERQGGRGGGGPAGGRTAAVHGLLVSGGQLAPAALGHRQGGGACPGDQPPLRRQQPAGGRTAARGDLRRVRRARREREPQ